MQNLHSHAVRFGLGSWTRMSRASVDLQTMNNGIEPLGLISDTFGQHTARILGSDETLNYHIWNSSGTYELANGSVITTFSHSEEDFDFIRSIIIELDKLIDIDFQETDDYQDSDIDIYSVYEYSGWQDATVGQAVIESQDADWWEILWKDTDQLNSLNEFDQNSIVHELGHALGLSHYEEDPWDSRYTSDDTIMSYNIGARGWSTWFRPADIEALQLIWGEEDDGLNSSTTYEGNSSEYVFINLGYQQFGLLTPNGTVDNITGIDSIVFSDRSYDVLTDIIAVFDQLTGLEEPSGVVFRLYSAAFNRLPDAAGLKFWTSLNSSGIYDYKQICNSFINSDEFRSIYGPNFKNEEFLTRMYENILGRVPDQAGFDFWLKNLNQGVVERDEVLFGFAESPENRDLFYIQTGLG